MGECIMSLDVSLNDLSVINKGSGIFVRENGSTREITRAEWDEKFPGQEPVVLQDDDSNEVYTRNITHNLNKMADAAGIYKLLWRPDELGISKASELVEGLRAGLVLLKSDRDKYEAFNPPNGRGDYDGLVKFVDSYIDACERHPDATISISR